MWNKVYDSWKDFSISNADLLRHVSLALGGAVGRLATNHRKFEGVSVQLIYDVFRTFVMSLVAVYIVDAVIAYYDLIGPSAFAASLGAAYYAEQITELISSLFPVLKEKIIKKVK